MCISHDNRPCSSAGSPYRPIVLKISRVFAAAKSVPKAIFKPPTMTLEEDRNKIFANIDTFSSKSDDEDSTKAAPKKKTKYDVPYDESDPTPP